MMVGISLHRNASSKEYNVSAHVAKAAWAYSYSLEEVTHS